MAFSGVSADPWAAQRLRHYTFFAGPSRLYLRAGFAASARHRMQKRFSLFLTWLQEEAAVEAADFESSEATAIAPRAFGLHMYEVGMPGYLFVYGFTATQDRYPQHRNVLTPLWQVAKKWQRAELGECRPVLPVACVRAAVGLGLLWEWYCWTAALIVSFLAVLHPGELIALTRKDLVFSEDILGHASSLFVHLTNPKTSRFARRQHGRIDDDLAIQFVFTVAHGLRLDEKIYPGSLHTFRRQWDAVPRKFRSCRMDSGSVGSAARTSSRTTLRAAFG